MRSKGCQSNKTVERHAVQPLCTVIKPKHLPRHTNADHPQIVGGVVRLHEADQRIDQRSRPVRPSHQVVDVVEPLGQIVQLAPGAAAAHFHRPPTDQAGKLGAALAGSEPGSVRDLARVRRFPKIGEGEIHLSLLRRERIEVALEIFGMVIDQVEKVVHQFAERQVPAEPG